MWMGGANSQNARPSLPQSTFVAVIETNKFFVIVFAVKQNF